MRARFAFWMGHPKAHWYVITIGLVLVAPSLFAGLWADDYFQYGLLNGVEVKQRNDLSLFNLFSFVNADPQRRLQLMDMSLIPWWTAPHFHYNFWRPLAEITHYVDYVWLTQHEMLMHVHSLLWFAALLLTLRRLLETVSIHYIDGGGVESLAARRNLFVLLALAAYAWDSTHGVTIAWLSNRGAIMSALFVLLVLLRHIKLRQQGGASHQVMALLFLACALLTAEIGVSAVAYLFAYAVFLDRAGPRRGLIALLPYVGVVAVWWVVYKQLGYGASGSVLYYVDPAENPGFFLRKLASRLPLFVGSQFGLIPAEFALFSPALNAVAVTAGAFVFVWLMVLLRLLPSRRLAGFFLLGSLLSMLPISAAIPQDRNLMLAGIGGSGLVGLLMVALWQLRHRMFGAKKFGVSSSVVVLIACHLVISPLLLAPLSLTPRLLSAPSTRAATSLDDDAKRIIAFNVPVLSVTYLMPTRFRLHEPLPEKFWSLTSSEAPTIVERVSDNVLRIRQEGGFLQQDDQLLRYPHTDPLHVGDKVALSGLDIEIVETLPDGRPSEILATFDHSLSDPQYQLMYWRDNEYHSFDLAVGAMRRLPDTEAVASRH